jgi:pimeloyl-ACP methyl ester carboxylesterase
VRLTLAPCHVTGTAELLRCGTFVVPEDRAHPKGRQLPLKVIIVPARDPHPREPVVFLSGGPGEAATNGAAFWVDAPFRRDHDIVLMDQRGTGEGGALDCPADDAGDLQADIEPLFHDVGAYAACAVRLSARADLRLYTTPVAMRDLDDLRQALGWRQIDLLGASYGTRAALVYIHMFGAHVRAAALSGVSALENRAPLHHSAAAQQALERVIAQCAADPACHEAFPDPMGDVRAVMQDLTVRPVRVTATDPASHAPGQLTLTAAGFADGLRVMLYSEKGGRAVPRLLSQARKGDYAPFAAAAVSSGYSFRHGLPMGLLLSVSCPEDVARIRPEDVVRETRGSVFGDGRVRAQMAACASWPQGPLPADYAAPFVSKVPTLLLSGALDPVTPSYWAELTRRRLPVSRHVILPGAHVPIDACVQALLLQMFETADPAALDTNCVGKITLPPFDVRGPA